jgi:hypothetical protein
MANQNDYYNVMSKENFNDNLADALMAAFDIHEVDSIELLNSLRAVEKQLDHCSLPWRCNRRKHFSLVHPDRERDFEESGEEVYQLYDRKTYYGNPIVLFEKLAVHGVIQSSDPEHFKLTSHDESIVITATKVS